VAPSREPARIGLDREAAGTRLYKNLLALINIWMTREMLESFTTRLALDTAEIAVIQTLRTSGPQRLGALATACGITPSYASRVVHNLVDRGLLTRDGAEDDRRAIVIDLTEAGVEVVERVWSEGGAMWAMHLHELSDEDIVTFEHHLGTLVEAASVRRADLLRERRDGGRRTAGNASP
jgi:DNA-binding MarR family transcriptional regulator